MRRYVAIKPKKSEMTEIMLKGWLNFDAFITYPSENLGWTIFEPIKMKIDNLKSVVAKN